MTMATEQSIARQLYPDEKGGLRLTGDYRPIIDHLGKVLLIVDTDGFQGDLYIVYDTSKDDWGWKYEVGFLNIGYGSCSGCDELGMCDTFDEADALIERLRFDIRTFDSVSEMLEYFKDGNHSYTYGDVFKDRFIPAIKAIIGQ